MRGAPPSDDRFGTNPRAVKLRIPENFKNGNFVQISKLKTIPGYAIFTTLTKPGFVWPTEVRFGIVDFLFVRE